MNFTPEQLLGPLNRFEKELVPDHIFLTGRKELLQQSKIAIVGTRSPSKEGVDLAKEFVERLVSLGICIVSGLAKGIDRVAHETAIKSGGNTIAVIGAGLDVFYPAENKALQSLIAKEHLLISQFAPGTKPLKHHFPMRNRFMALISNATLIIEAGTTSGTISQGWEAIRLNRPLFISELLAESNHPWVAEFIKYGAQVLTPSDLDDIFEVIPYRTSVDASSLAA